MAKKSNKKDTGQLELPIHQLLEDQPGELHKLPIDPNDIGGELLAILSNGLYTNPLDCLREYVQNAVDARATNVIIKITGNSVMLFDDGNGMNLDDLLQARQFGLSPKSLAQHVGFRGIGIYSGFDICRRLRLTSKKVGEPHVHVLVFDFEAMQAKLDEGREEGRVKISLIDLLSEHTYIKREPSTFPAERHFTQVELQDISDVHIKQLSDRPEVRRYLLLNLPIDFSDDFEHKKIINEKLSLHVTGYNPIKVTLQSDGLPDELVSKYGEFKAPQKKASAPQDKEDQGLQFPDFGFIETSTGHRVAYYWSCLNKTRDRINNIQAIKVLSPDERLDYEGFVYKIKGFTIGDRNKLRPMFARKGQLYPWFTGEIYVLDDKVIPNAERNDFETNEAKRTLEQNVLIKLDEGLLKDAERFQAQGLANERIRKYQEEVSSIEKQVNNNTVSSSFDAYAHLSKVLDGLKRQKGSATKEDKATAEKVQKLAESLQKQLRREVDTATPESTKNKRAANKGQTQAAASANGSGQATHSGNARNGKGATDTTGTSIKTLPMILRDSGWSLDDTALHFVDVIQSSIEDVLMMGSPHYNSLLDQIESKLADSYE